MNAYERSYGYRYDEATGSATDIAKLIRRDIAQAKEEGLLPSHWAYSVRSDVNSINVEVRDCGDAWQACDGTTPGTRHTWPDGSTTATACSNVWCAARNDPAYAHAAQPHDVLTEDGKAAKMTLQRIHDAYNHDGSEMQVDYFDVRYYGGVSFEDASSADFRQREAERLASRKAARESGTIVGRVANYKRDGSRVVHLLAETTDGKKVLACGARIWRGAVISKVADDTPVDCSRCAKHVAPAQA